MAAGILRHALWPWWAFQLATGAKSFVDNPLIGSRRLNEAGLHVARLKLAHRMAWARRHRLARLIDPADRAAFDRDGLVLKRDFLPPDAFQRLREQTGHYQGPAREMIQGDTITRRIALDPEALATMPDARRFLDDKRFRGLVRYVGSYDSQPLCYLQTILARRYPGAPDPQLHLHADTFHPTVKAWFFLDDVAEDDGPFTYVPGSHLLTPERIAWERRISLDACHAERLTARGSFRVTSAELPALNLPAPASFAVPANTLVVADTFGFHARGAANHASTRVEIWAYGRRNPYLPWAGLDPMSLPGITERRISWRWRFRDRYARWIGQPWRDVGRKTAFQDDCVGP
jgi:hypothetical protein